MSLSHVRVPFLLGLFNYSKHHHIRAFEWTEEIPEFVIQENSLSVRLHTGRQAVCVHVCDKNDVMAMTSVRSHPSFPTH